MWWRPHRLLLLAGLTLAAPVLAAEPDKTTAREAYARGAQAFGEGSYAVAAAELSRADALAPDPVALEAALKAVILADDPVLGMDLVERAEARPPHEKVAFEAARARQKFASRAGKLKIACAEPGCRVKVGGEDMALDQVRWFRAGNHVVEVIRAGKTELHALQVLAGSTVEWRPPPLEAPLPSAEPTSTASAKPTGSTAVFAPSVSASIAPPPPRDPLSPVWFGLGSGATALLGGFAIGFGADTLSQHDAFVKHRTAEAAASGLDAQLRTNVFIGAVATTAAVTVVLGLLTFR